jgi:predicted regulator of Ras-like GTPase activity (Roadblock/LC7/MglB family)
MLHFLLLIILPLLALAGPAHAAPVSLQPLADLLTAFVNPLLQTAAALLVGYLALLAKTKFNLSIEKDHRDALQTALTNAASLVVQKVGQLPFGQTIEISNPAVAEAVNYVIRAVPDAIKAFGLTPDALAEKIAAKIPQVN